MNNCEYNGVEGISFRDDSWEESKIKLLEAHSKGYRYYVIDDSFMIFDKPPIDDNDDDVISGCVDNCAALLEAASTWWDT